MKGFSLTSFMDVIACGLGAAILLFLISATAQKGFTEEQAGDLLLVRCQKVSGRAGLIGIEFCSPSRPAWQLANSDLESDDGFVFASANKDDPTLISLVLIFDPEKGPWRFRPVLLDVTHTEGESATTITLSVEGKSVKSKSGSTLVAGSQLREIGRPGAALEVEVR